MTDKNYRIVVGVDHDGEPVKVGIKSPTADHFRDSQLEYNKAFRAALDSGALLRQKLNDHMIKQGIWDKDKQKHYEKLTDDIRNMESILKGGGIRLSEAKKVALELRDLREEFRDLLSEKNALDSNSAEGQADNARFIELVRLCIVNPDTGSPLFPEQKDYDAQSDQPWVIDASAELANMLYGLDPDYDKNLEENKFLREFKFVNDDLRFINKDGHMVDSKGRLVNEDGRFIAYRTEEGLKSQNADEVYFVDRDGEELISKTHADGTEEWIKISLQERRPFLDDDDKPIEIQAKEEQTTTTKSKPAKRKPRATKTDAKTV